MARVLKLVAHDGRWKARFDAAAAALHRALGATALAIEHIGSTSVPGLLGKPVLDIGVAVASRTDADACITPLQALGYTYRGPYGEDPRRRYYVRNDAHGQRVAHLHLYILPAQAWADKLAFRDALRTDLVLARAYAAEKLRVADAVDWDKRAYSLGKGPFIEQVLKTLRGGESGAIPLRR